MGISRLVHKNVQVVESGMHHQQPNESESHATVQARSIVNWSHRRFLRGCVYEKQVFRGFVYSDIVFALHSLPPFSGGQRLAG
jgi:hypothetical protein